MALQVGEVFATMTLDTKELDTKLAQVTSQFQGIGTTLAGLGLTAAVTRPLVNAAKEIYSYGSEFEAEMSRVGAVMNLEGLGMSADEAAAHMESLRDTALDLGEKTSLSAMQAAEAMEALAMAGWDSSSIENAIEPLVRLVEVAGTGDLQEAASIVADSLTALGEGADQAGRLADVLTAAATGSNTDLSKLGMTFKYVASMAGNLGYSMEDLALASGVLANSGIKAQKAGTSLRAMLNRMSSNSKAQKAMETLGVSMYDAEGKALSLRDVMGQLRSSMAGLTQEEKTQMAYALGGTSGMNAVLAIVNATEEAYQDLARSIDESEGAASSASKKMLDNLKGDMTLLDSALGTTKIMLLDTVDEMGRTAVQSLTGLVQAFNGLGQDGQKGVMMLGAAMASLGPGITVLGGLESMAVHLLPALVGLASPMSLLTAGLGAMALAAFDADGSMARLIDRMADSGGKWLDGLEGKLQEAFPVLDTNMQRILDSLIHATEELLPRISSVVLTGLSGIMETLAGNMDRVSDLASTILTSLAQSFADNAGTLVTSGVHLMQSLIEGTLSALPDLLSAAETAFLALADALMDTNWGEVGESLFAALQSVLESVPERLQPAVDHIAEKLGSLFQDTEGLESNLDSLTGKITTALTTFGAQAQTGIQSFGSTLVSALETIDVTDAMQHLTGQIGELLSAGLTSVSGVAGTLLSTLGEVLGSIDLNQILPSIVSLAEKLSSALGESLGSLISGGLGLTEGLVQMISTIDLGDVISGLVTIAKNLFTTILEAFTEGGKQLGESVVQAFQELDIAGSLETVSGEVTSAAESLLKAIGSAITEGLPGLISVGTEMAASLVETMSTVLASAVEGLSDFGEMLLTSIGASLADLDLTRLITSLTTAAGKLLEAFGGAFASAAKGYTGLAEGLASCLSNLDISQILTSLESLAGSLTDALGKAISGMGTATSGIADAILSLFSSLDLGAIEETLTSIAEDVSKLLFDALKTAFSTAGNILDSLGDALAHADFASLGTAAGEIATNLMNSLTDFMGTVDVGSVISSLSSALANAAYGLADAASAFLTQLITTLTDADAMARFFEAGTRLIAEIGRGLLEGVGTLAAALFESVARVVGNAFAAATGTEFKDRTKDIRLFENTSFSVDPALFDKAQMTGREIERKLAELLAPGGITSGRDLDMTQALYDTMVKNGEYFMIGLQDGLSHFGNEGFVESYRTVLNGLSQEGSTKEAGGQAALLYAAGFQEQMNSALYDAGAAGEAVQAVSESMQEALRNVQWEDGLLDVSVLAQSLETDLSEVLGFAIPEGYRLAFDGVQTELQKITQDGFETIVSSTSLDGILNSMELWEEIKSTALAGFDGMEADLMEALSEMGVTMGDLLGVELSDSIHASIENALAEGNLEGAAAMLVTSLGLDDLKETIRSEVSDAGNAITEGMEAAAQNADPATSLVESMTGAAESAVEAASSTLSAGSEKVAQASEQVSRASLEAFQKTMTGEEGKGVAESYLEGMTNALTEGGAALTENATTMATETVESVKSILTESEGSETGKTYANAILAAFQEAHPQLTQEAQSMAQAILEAMKAVLNQSSGQEITSAFTSGLLSGLQSAQCSLTSAASSIASSMVSSVSSQLSAGAGASIAAQFTAGLSSGIASGVSSAVSSARQVASSAASAVKSSWKINSPSKVAMELGAYFTQGLQEGLHAGLTDVQSEMGRLGDIRSLWEKGTARLQVRMEDETGLSATSMTELLRDILDSVYRLTDISGDTLDYTSSQAADTARALSLRLMDEGSLTSRTRRETVRYGEAGTDRDMYSMTNRRTQEDREDTDMDRVAEMLSRALSGCTVQMDGRTVGTLVAPTVSEVIQRGVQARRFAY